MADLARHAGLSHRTLIRRFKATTSMTLQQWLSRERLTHAQQLLETTDLPVSNYSARWHNGHEPNPAATATTSTMELQRWWSCYCWNVGTSVVVVSILDFCDLVPEILDQSTRRVAHADAEFTRSQLSHRAGYDVDRIFSHADSGNCDPFVVGLADSLDGIAIGEKSLVRQVFGVDDQVCVFDYFAVLALPSGPQ